jgi:ubiquinone/menaquinone biosynthesis C-methylase UbiE
MRRPYARDLRLLDDSAVGMTATGEEEEMQERATEQTWKDIERTGWNRNAPGYDARGGQLTHRAVGPMLDAVAARPGMRLLDVCCGPGYAAGAAAERGLEAVGVDIAPAMISEARRRFPSVEFHEGDAENLGFPDASFDAVICAFGLLHLPDAEAAVAEAFRVLKSGGRYAFTVWCQPEQARLLGLAFKALTIHADMTVPLPPAPPMFKFSDPEAANRALSKAGFRDMAIDEVPITFHGRSPQDVFDWLDKGTVRTMALFRLQTPESRERIRAAILEGAEEYSSNGKIEIPCPALLCSARRP